MALRYGFFNSVNGDRTYDADDFGDMFTGLINDGIYKDIGDMFSITPGPGLSVVVGTGKAWFNKTWSTNTTKMQLNLELASFLLPRIDAVVLEVNKTSFTRANSLKVLTGTPSANPERPSLTMSSDVYQYPLAYIRVSQNAESVAQADITTVIGTTACPYVNAIIDQLPMENVLITFQGEYEDWFESLKEYGGDEALLVSLKFQLDEANTKVASLTQQISSLEAEVDAIKAALG